MPAAQGPRSTVRTSADSTASPHHVQNYALGFTVTFPLMDRAAIQAREAQQSATIRAEAARYRQIATI
jgi:hypothetical protein